MFQRIALAGLGFLPGCFEVADLPPCQFNEQCGPGKRCELESGKCVARTDNTTPLPLPDATPAIEHPDIEYVYVPAGTFQMGEADGEDTTPLRGVAVSDFYLSRHEVTLAEYRPCVEAGQCRAPREGNLCVWGSTGQEAHPINCLTWFDAAQFAAWVGGRLPSEAEWEFAARGGGADVQWPWGNEAPTCATVALTGPSSGCGPGGTLPACIRVEGNVPGLGLCDMAGNVAEWLQDSYLPDYTDAPSDGSAVVDGTSERVHRGAGWAASAEQATTRLRGHADPNDWDPALGFRVARD